MALPTAAEQRHTDIDRMYATGLPWVKSASVSSRSCYVRMQYGPNPAWAGVDDAFARAEAGCFIRVADLAAPARGTVITIAGVDWKIDEASVANDYEWRLALERNVKVRF